MSFTIFTAGTKINPDEVTDNFYHIGQGNFLPRGGASLEPTTSVYDLGSSVYKFDTVHVETIHARQTQTFELIAEINLSTTASQIEITGLNGDTNEIYQIQFNYIQASDNLPVYMSPNGDTTTSYSHLINQVETSSTTRYVITRGFLVNNGNITTTAGINNYFSMNLIAQTGRMRSGVANMNRTQDKQSYEVSAYFYQAVWKDTTNTITSLLFHMYTTTANFATGTTVRILSRGLE